MTVTPTRTIGPLHLEDLEPHRFEDLIRQLLYDFRDWYSLEAAGRTGRDDGFDVVGVERWEAGRRDLEEEADEDSTFQTRKWLVQCKRERSIGPKRLLGYLDGLPLEAPTDVYGIVFAAASDFSISAREAFRGKCREVGLSEAHLWGKAEIEDQLFQPKNDHLLFAYFGVSLKTRKRTLKTEIRARLATKRKAFKALSPNTPIMIRDASDERYPFLAPDKSTDRRARGRWGMFQFRKCAHNGLQILTHRHFAFLSDDGTCWDYAETHNDAVSRHDDPWYDGEEETSEYEQRAEIWQVWEQWPENNKAWFEIVHVNPYENVLAIDEDGDEGLKGPHVYTDTWRGEDGPFLPGVYVQLKTVGRPQRVGDPDKATRIQQFKRSADVCSRKDSQRPGSRRRR